MCFVSPFWLRRDLTFHWKALSWPYPTAKHAGKYSLTQSPGRGGKNGLDSQLRTLHPLGPITKRTRLQSSTRETKSQSQSLIPGLSSELPSDKAPSPSDLCATQWPFWLKKTDCLPLHAPTPNIQWLSRDRRKTPIQKNQEWKTHNSLFSTAMMTLFRHFEVSRDLCKRDSLDLMEGTFPLFFWPLNLPSRKFFLFYHPIATSETGTEDYAP